MGGVSSLAVLLLAALMTIPSFVSGTGALNRQAVAVNADSHDSSQLRGQPPTKFAPAGTKVASLTVEAASGQAASLVLLSKDKPAYVQPGACVRMCLPVFCVCIPRVLLLQ